MRIYHNILYKHEIQSGPSSFVTSHPLSTHADLLKLVTTCVREGERTGDLGGQAELKTSLSWNATYLRTLKIYGMMLLKLSS